MTIKVSFATMRRLLCLLSLFSLRNVLSSTDGASTISSSPSKNLRWSHEAGVNRVLNTAGGRVVSNVPATGITKKWSDPTTWNASTLPGLDDNVLITGSENVVEFDVLSSPLLNSITIEDGAKLIIPDPLLEGSPLQLNVRHIHIMGVNSAFEAGTEAVPIHGRVSIRLHGTKATLPLYGRTEAGNKVIFVHGGRLDIHGTPRSPTWTRLAATANASSTSLVVRGEVDWKAGEQIAITSSDFDVDGFDEQFEAQELTIASDPLYDNTNGKTFIQFEQPLNYTHFGERQCFEDVCVDTVAEVVLLSRNVVVEGTMDVDSQEEGWGGQTKMHSTDSRVSYVELKNMGQKGQLGSYPLHWHIPGNAAGCFAKGNSIHHSFNRAITLHGAQEMEIVQNVAYEILGHSIYLEDGTETNNLLQENIVFTTRQGFVDRTMHGDDVQDDTPASYWISNPHNRIIGNVAGGSVYSGFWIVPDKNAPGDPSICPRYAPLIDFKDNVAHSNKKYGIEIERWLPKAGCSDSADDIPATLHNTLVFKCGYNGIRFSGTGGNGAIVLDGLVAVDNARTYQTSAAVFYSGVSEDIQHPVGVRNGIFIHTSFNNPFRRDPVRQIRRGFHLPQTDFIFIEDCIFVNYSHEGWVFDPDRTTKPDSKIGFEVQVQGLRFIDSPNRVHFRFHHHAIIDDLDGSLTETGTPSQIVAASPIFDSVNCFPSDNIATIAGPGEIYDDLFHSVPLLSCKDLTIRRFGRGEFGPGNDGQLHTWAVTNEGTITQESPSSFGSNGRFTLTCPTNVVIDISWNDAHLPDEWYLPIGRRYMGSSEYVHFKFHVRTLGHRLSSFNVFFGDVPSTDLVGVPLSSSIRGHYLDISTEILHVMFVHSDDIFIAFNEWSPIDSATPTPSDSSAPTFAPVQTTTDSPSPQPSILPLLPSGSPCTHGSSCESGFCGGMNETICMDMPQCI